ncbi:TCR/Tet family MFS transporter [Phenylobacterium sp.]|uniref:TCR/Tet family MFS transporter n=1 Tax=Phenylobacterium sp. TaxID=1871053 RepID=UPI0025E415ED|nr:TCR/Tet family MFS transporter [Phenylobacterium sp.]MBX3483010.1 TCR/Tet family MFS transporter [Phenylobacterium sp.]
MTDAATPSTTPSGGRQAGFGFIFALALMNAVSFGIMIPILPQLVRELAGGDTAAASEWTVVFAVTWGIMQFFCGPLLGMLSDRIGRRPVLLLSLFGLALDFLFMAFAPTLWWLLLGRILNGATAASFSTASAYLADVTPPERRAKVFGWMGSAFSFGFIMGPTIGGFLGQGDLRVPFLAAAGLTAVNWLYGFFVLPESLPPEKRATSFDWGRANPVGSLRLLRSRMGLLPLAGVGFLFQFAHTVLPTVFVLYTTYRYHWDSRTLGLTFLLTGVLGVIVSMFLVGPTVARIGERRTLLLGLAATAFGFAWYGWADTGWLYLLGAPVFALSGFIMPGLQGLMTRRVQPHEQGQLQGANQSLMGIGSILGPALFGEAFARALRGGHPPGLPIYLASGLLVAALSLAFAAARAPASAPQPAE